MSKEVLLAGESWVGYATHAKGFDNFHASVYETGERWLKATLEENGYEVTFISDRLVGEELPFTVEELKKCDAMIFSDIGMNTFPLSLVALMGSKKKPNRYNPIRDYVLGGGASMMVRSCFAFSDVDMRGK